MKKLSRFLFNVLLIMAFCASLLASALGIAYEIIGPAKFEKLLCSIGIENGFELIWIITAIAIFLLIVTYRMRRKFLNP